MMVSEQKIIQVGNSLALTIPSAFVRQRKIKVGQTIHVDMDGDSGVMSFQLGDKGRDSITPEFKRWLQEFMDEHEDTLRELAKR